MRTAAHVHAEAYMNAVRGAIFAILTIAPSLHASPPSPNRFASTD